VPIVCESGSLKILVTNGPAGARTGMVLLVFLFYIKENKKETTEGLFRVSTWQIQKRKEKLISYNVLYKIILINPSFGTQHRISVSQEKGPNFLNHLLFIKGSQDVIISILSKLIAGRPRRLGSNPSKVKMLCALRSHPNQFWNPYTLFREV